MIKPRIAENNKICLVYDSAQALDWQAAGKVTSAGIIKTLSMFKDAGIGTDDISAVCLCDASKKGKAQDYKDKLEHVKELFDTQAFNVLVPVGAEAFTRVVGFKGMQKYIGKSLLSETYPNQKVIPLQNPLQAVHDPTVTDNNRAAIELLVTECEFPELTMQDKMPVYYTVMDNIEAWRDFVAVMNTDEAKVIAYDTETRTFDYLRGDLLTIQWSHKPGYSYLLPCAHYHEWSDEDWSEIVQDIVALHTRTDKVIVGHNKKYDDLWMKHQLGVPLRRHGNFDTQIASFCCNENEPNDLKTNAMKFTDMGDYEFEQERWIDAYCSNKQNNIKKSDFTYDLIPFEIICKYALQDADATRRLYDYYVEELIKEDQVAVNDMMLKFQYFLATCESNGWPVDVEYCGDYLEELNDRIITLESDIMKSPQVCKAWDIRRASELAKQNAKRKLQRTELLHDVDFKLNSTPNKQSLFFDVMKLPVIKKTKSGNSATDKEVVDQWIVKKPSQAEFLLKFREYGNLCKMRSTYVMALIEKQVEGRVHPTYTLTSAKTGRTSCKSPNWQNIPAHSAEAKKIKRAVAATEGRVILGADLQACEMRWCAVYSGDSKLISIFDNKLDIHGSIAKDLFPYIDCHVNDVKSLYKFERNEVSKRVQFGALYGMGPQALTRNINASLISQLKDGKITKAQFEELKYTDEMSALVLSDYFHKYAGVTDWIESVTKFVLENGYSLSLLGRKRRVPAVRSEDDNAKAKAIRQAVNATIQSVASDALLLAAYNFLIEIEDNNLPITILGSIHDALYIETDDSFKTTAAELMVRHLKVMPIATSVPMEAEAEWGNNWNEFSEDFGTAVVVEEDSEDEEEES